MARHKTRKCPNCGRETIVKDKWSCQWCHWPLFAKHPPGIEQRKSVLWPLTWRWAVVVLVVIIILYGVVLFDYSDWKLAVFQQLVLGQWHILLLAIFIPLAFLYLVTYLAAKIRPEFIVVTLLIVGMLLLFSSDKENILYKYVSGWINAGWDINLFAVAITVLSLALTFAGIIIVGRTKK